MSEKLTKDELLDRIAQVSGFLAGYGDVAEIAAERLRRLMDEIDERGVEAAGRAALENQP